jgi:parallel beta-helix repeat protein
VRGGSITGGGYGVILFANIAGVSRLAARNLSVNGAGQMGIAAYALSPNTLSEVAIEGNRVKDTTGYGIYLFNAGRSAVAGNRVSGSTTGASFQGMCLQLSGVDGAAVSNNIGANCAVRGLNCVNCGASRFEGNQVSASPTGMYFDGNSTQAMIIGNRLVDCDTYGIQLLGMGGLVEGNLVIGGGLGLGTAIALGGDFTFYAGNHHIYSNSGIVVTGTGNVNGGGNY